MSYQEKRTSTEIFTSLLVLSAYCIYVFGVKDFGSTTPLKTWAGTMLVFMGINIALNILVQILFHILYSVSIAIKDQMHNAEFSEERVERSIEAEFVEDERDRLIDLKATRTGFIVSGLGLGAGLILLVLDYSPAVMLNVLYIALYVGSITEGAAELYQYRKGI